jgi:hypothetical protein
MDGQSLFESKRSRTIIGLVVVAVSLVLSVALAGLSFAQSSTITAAEYQYGKVTICHHTHSKTNPTVTIVVSAHAWPAHRKHGDTLGACPNAASSPSRSKGNGNAGSNHGNASKGSTSPGTGKDQPGQADHGKPGDAPGHEKGRGK